MIRTISAIHELQIFLHVGAECLACDRLNVCMHHSRWYKWYLRYYHVRVSMVGLHSLGTPSS